MSKEIKDIGRLIEWLKVDSKRWKLRLQKTKIDTHPTTLAISKIISEIEVVQSEMSRIAEKKLVEVPEWENWFKYVSGASSNIFVQIYAHIDWKKVKSCSSLPSYVGIGKRQGNKYIKSLAIQQSALFCGFNSPIVKKLRMGVVRVKKGAYARFFQDEVLKYSKQLVDSSERFKNFTPMNLVLYCLTNTAQLWLSHLTMVHFWLNHKILLLPYSVVHAGHDWVYLPPLDKKNDEDWVNEMEDAIYDQGVKPVVMDNVVRSGEEMKKLLPSKYLELLSK